MRRSILAIGAAASLLAACSEPPQAPLFTDPIPLTMPSGPDSVGPRLASGPGVPLLLSWMTRLEHGGELQYSVLADANWREARSVVSDENMFVNWADVPQVVPVTTTDWLAHWLSKSADATYAYDIKLAGSTNGGVTWTPLPSPHDDGTPTEHGFVSTVPANGGTRMLWLDGRNMPDAGMTLRSAIVSVDGVVSAAAELDDKVCECCRTDIAAGSAGPIAVYRNRTAEEIRDIYVARYVDGAWQPGTALSQDNWNISGCPVNGPAIDARGSLVAVAWFTAANDHPRVQLRLSRDGGETFGEPLRIATNNVAGQVHVAVIDDEAVAVSWVHRTPRDDLASIMLRSVTIDGAMSRPDVVGRTADQRAVPQMKQVGDRLYFAWTDRNGDTTRLASARVTIITGDEDD